MIAFPPDDNITALILSKDTTLEAAFPPAAPYKILYSVYALRSRLVQQTQNVREQSSCVSLVNGNSNVGQGPASVDFIHHGIQTLSVTLPALNLNIGSRGAEVDIAVALGLVDCLLIFLRGLRSSFLFKITC